MHMILWRDAARARLPKDLPGRRPGRRRSWGIAVLVAAILGGAGAACSPAADVRRPDIILITIDTLRADHLGCYGYPRATSPFIDSLAMRGTLFRNAFATSSWTAPSMASIFTGLYPRRHGVRHGFVQDDIRIASQEFLSPRFSTLAGLLKEAGYTTFGVSSNGHLTEKTGFDHGFEHFSSLWFELSPAPNRVVEGWSEQIRNASPFFLWVHYFDPHGPYFARQPWIGDYSDARDSLAEWAEMPMDRVRANAPVLMNDPVALQTLLDLYDSEINFADHHLRALFELLQLKDDPLIILSSDHGEEFLEHGYLEHGVTLFEEVVRVPLIFVLPEDRLPGGRVEGRSIEQVVSNRHIMPTILDYLDLDLPVTSDARSLLPYLIGEGGPQPRPVFTELDREGVPWNALRIDAWKFMCVGRDLESCFLFDLSSDPGEQTSLLPQERQMGERLANELTDWISANPLFQPRQIDMTLDEEQKKRLKSLGYTN